MEDNEEHENSFFNWEKSFRQKAENDNYQVFRAHLKKLKLPDEPILLLDGTILFVRSCVGYLMLDNLNVEKFLAQQQYDWTESLDAPYLVTFDIYRQAYARIFTPMPSKLLDFADLYGTPWDPYRLVGYNEFFISRSDGQPLSLDEIAALDDAVSRDIRFDYGEAEVELGFDPDTIPGVLLGSIQDALSDFDEEAEEIEI